MPLFICALLLFLNQDCVSVRIANQESSLESQLPIRFGYHSGRYKLRVCGNELFGSILSIGSHEFGLPMDDVVGAFIRREGLTSTRSQVLQQFDSGARLRPE